MANGGDLGIGVTQHLLIVNRQRVVTRIAQRVGNFNREVLVNRELRLRGSRR